MCGIAALISNKYVQCSLIEDMLKSIVHRGPDDSGVKICVEGKVILGHRRLSIIDLSQCGHQPMEYLNGRYTITYNGEIYNYIEIKNTLIEKGYRFSTSSDTEVVLAAYDYWGIECQNQFNGMWAFVIYDNLKEEVFVSRDRFGVKPLYYWISQEGFVAFASEIKEFFQLPGWKGKCNPQKSYEFLMYGITDHTDETMYAEVNQIRGGECAKFSANKNFSKKYIQRWYDLNICKFTGSFEDATDIFKNLFFDAIKLRLRSDVPIGSCLSGGLDSSSIVCVIDEILKDTDASVKQMTVSAGSKDKRYDEMNYVQYVLNERSNIDGVKIYPDIANLFTDLPTLLYHQDEPFGSTSIYASWRVFETAARNGLKVMLDGQGADESLAGYDGFYQVRFANLLERFRLLQLAKEVKNSHDLRNIHYFTWIKACLKMFLMKNDAIYKKIHKAKNRKLWLNSKLLKEECFEPASLRFNTDIYEEQIKGLFACNLPQLLHYEDRNTMAFSIEGRLPFLDYRVVEFVLSLPDDFCISDGVTKRVLRASMQNILPDEVRCRMSKLGFVTPEEVWLKRNPRLFREKVQSAVDSTNGIITPYAVKHFDDMAEGKIPFDFSVWRIVCFGEWGQRMASCAV